MTSEYLHRGEGERETFSNENSHHAHLCLSSFQSLSLRFFQKSLNSLHHTALFEQIDFYKPLYT